MDNSPAFGRVTLVVGPESLLAERATERAVRAGLAERPDAAVNRLDAAGLDAGSLTEATGGSLFASSSVVVLADLADLPTELADAVASLATSPVEDVALVLVHSGGNKGKGLLDRVRKAGATVVECAPVKAWELASFAVAEARLLGGRLDKPVAELLVGALGADTRAIAGAVRQLLDDADDSSIGEAAVRRYFAGRADVTSFTVADHVLAGQRDAALGALRWALETGVAPVLVTSALASALRNLGRYTEVQSARMRDADVAREIGVPPWKVKDLVRQSRDWTPLGLARSLQAVARADAAVKGAAVDPGFALEQLVMQVAAERGRRPDAGMGR